METNLHVNPRFTVSVYNQNWASYLTRIKLTRIDNKSEALTTVPGRPSEVVLTEAVYVVWKIRSVQKTPTPVFHHLYSTRKPIGRIIEPV